jgi:hypothetical protein
MKELLLFCKYHSDSTKKFSVTDIIKMLQILIDNIFVQIGVGGRVFQQTISIPMGTNNAYLVRSIPHTGASQGNQKRS